jgi:O-antigen/teichoic acid export membrane protein
MSESGSESVLRTDDLAISHSEYVLLIAKGAGVVFIGGIIGGGLGYLFQVVVARCVGAELFGLFSLGLAVFNIAEMIASLGMGRGVVRYVSLYQGEGDQRRVKGTIRLTMALSLGGGIVVSLLLIALSEVLAINIFHAARLTDLLRFFAIAVPFSVLTTVLTSSIRALRIMRYAVYVRDLFEPLSRIALVILVSLLGWKLWGAIFAFAVSIVAGTFLSLLFYRQVFHSVVKAGVQPIFELKEILAFCWPLFFADGFYLAQGWISTFLLGYFATPEAVGIFSAAYRTSLLLQGIIMSFNTIFAPIISALHYREENKTLESLFKIVTKWVFSLGFPITLLVMIFSQEILAIFGQDFAIGTASLIVLSIGQFINSTTGPLGLLITMSGRSKITLLNTAFYFFLQAGLCFLLIPQYGVLGAALAAATSLGFLNAVQLLQVYLILRMHPFRAGLLKPLVAGGASALIVSLAKTSFLQMDNPVLPLVLGASIFLVVYGLTLFWLGFDEEDRIILRKMRTRLAF